MLEIKRIGSGSDGNCYLVSDFQTTIILELGLDYKEMLKKMNYEIKADYCLVTHGHKDHCKAIPEICKFIKTYVNQNVYDSHTKHQESLNLFETNKQFKIGTFIVMPFELYHDVPNNGFLIYSTKTKEKLLYITDTMFIKNKFRGITHLMLECNHITEILDNNPNYNDALKMRVKRTHLSLDSALEFIRENKEDDKLQQIKLIHLSKENSDKDIMLNKVKEIVSNKVEVEVY